MTQKQYFPSADAPERFLFVYAHNIRNVAVAMHVMTSAHGRMLEDIPESHQSEATPDGNELSSPQNRADTFHTVYREMSITYSVAIFDSFLNSMTRYVMFNLPEKVLGSTSVEVRQLIAKPSDQVISEQLDKRAESISRESFVSRIRFLENVLETDFQYDKDEIGKLKEIVRIRNLITHDARSFNMVLNDDRSVSVGAIREVADSDLDADIETLERLVPKLYQGCCEALLKRKLNDNEIKVLLLMSGSWRSTTGGM
jgi:hypothetical protein